jgi:hypothetical protein
MLADLQTQSDAAARTRQANRIVGAVVAILMLSSCSNLFAIRDGNFGTVSGKYTTADYRLISQRRRADDANPLIVCSEPSPDIAKAFSTAVSGSVGRGIDAAEASYQQAEAIAQLGKRYATVQLLRDIRFRDCEDYANGVIDRVEYGYRLSRFAGLVVTLLGLEMVSGDTVTTAQPTISPTLVLTGNGKDNGQSDSSAETGTSKGKSTTANNQADAGRGNQANAASSTSDKNSATAMLAAAAKAMDAADQAMEQAKVKTGLIPTQPASAEKAAVTAVDAAYQSTRAAYAGLQTTWSEVLNSGGQLNTNASTALKAAAAKETTAQTATAKLNTITTNASQPVKNAAQAVTKATTQFSETVKALTALQADNVMKSTNPNSGVTATLQTANRTVSDAQVAGIVNLQAAYLKFDGVQAQIIPCASAESALVVDGRTPLTAFQLFCLRGAKLASTGEGQQITSENPEAVVPIGGNIQTLPVPELDSVAIANSKSLLKSQVTQPTATSNGASGSKAVPPQNPVPNPNKNQ